MSKGLYELIALAARYFFAALMILIALRAWRITIKDSRRAAQLRRWSPEVGIIGEVRVLEGDERAKRGMVYPVIREGMIGRSRKSDIRLRSRSVKQRHAYFEMTPDGLLLRLIGAGYVSDHARQRLLRDGDRLQIGKVSLLLVLNEGTLDSYQTSSEEIKQDELFDITESAGVSVLEFSQSPQEDADEAADRAIYGTADKNNKQTDEEEWWNGKG